MPADESKATASDIAANAMGHALMGAVVAQLSGKDAVAGAVGAAGGELTARLLIMKELYSGRDTSDLTEAEKQSVSALASLAAGLASGIASGNTTGAATGAQAGRNAVENNYLSATEAQTKADLERKEKAGTLTADEAKELADTRKLDKDRDQAIHDICTQGNKSGGACSALVAKAQQALNSYGESAASYRLIYKDLYPQDAANASAILKGLDEGSITRDAAITAIAKSTGKGWDEVASQYDTAMQLQAIAIALVGMKGMQIESAVNKGSTAKPGNSSLSSFDANEIRFSQNTVSNNKTDRGTGVKYTYDDLVSSMRKDGWKGDPVDVVKMPDGNMTSMDNTRISAARDAGIRVEANVRSYDDKLTSSEIERFSDRKRDFIPQTWGEAITGRINKQSGGFGDKNPYGSYDVPRVTGKGK